MLFVVVVDLRKQWKVLGASLDQQVHYTEHLGQDHPLGLALEVDGPLERAARLAWSYFVKEVQNYLEWEKSDLGRTLLDRCTQGHMCSAVRDHMQGSVQDLGVVLDSLVVEGLLWANF
jgi:hypothetical protein